MRKIYYLNTKDATKVIVAPKLRLRVANHNVRVAFGDRRSVV